MPTADIILALDRKIQDQVTLLFQLDQQIGELRRARRLLANGEEDLTARPKPIAISDPDFCEAVVARNPTPAKSRSSSPSSASRPGPRSKFSAAGRQAISRAQKLRWKKWAEQRAEQTKKHPRGNQAGPRGKQTQAAKKAGK